MGPTALSWVLPRNKTCCFLIHHHIIQCLVPNTPPAGSPIPWQYVLGTQPANIIAKFLTLRRKVVTNLHSNAVPGDWLLQGTTLPWNVRNYLSNDAASYPRLTESSATLLWQPCISKHCWQLCISQHCCDNPVSQNTVVTIPYLTMLVTTMYLTTLS